MDYKFSSIQNLNGNGNENELDVFNQRNGIFFVSNKAQDISFDLLRSFPIVLESMKSIKKEISKLGIDKSCVFSFLKEIDKVIINNSPKPYPNDLAKLFLETLISLVDKSIDEETKIMSLKIINYVSISSSEGISMFFTTNAINSILKVISKKNYRFLTMNEKNNYSTKLIYSLAILENLFNCNEQRNKVYHFYIENYLLQILNDLLPDLYSYQAIDYIFSLIKRMLNYSIDLVEDIDEYDFLIPSLIKLIPFAWKVQKKSLECLLIFLKNQKGIQNFVSNNFLNVLYDNISQYSIHYFMKCINIICLHTIYPPFNNLDFYKRLIDFVQATNDKGAHEIFIFFNQVIIKDPNFDQNLLFQAIYNSIKKHNFNYQIECINFTLQIILNNYYNFSNDLMRQIIFYLLDITSELPDECAFNCFRVFQIILSKQDQISNEILANDEFIELLRDCSSNPDTDEDIFNISSKLLSEYIDDQTNMN